MDHVNQECFVLFQPKTPELSKQGQIVHCMNYFLGAKVCGKLKKLLNFQTVNHLTDNSKNPRKKTK